MMSWTEISAVPMLMWSQDKHNDQHQARHQDKGK